MSSQLLAIQLEAALELLGVHFRFTSPTGPFHMANNILRIKLEQHVFR